MKYFFAFTFFWLTAFVFYFKTAGAGFASDTVGWFQIFRDTGWQGIISAFGDKSLHYGYQFLFFLFYKLFGLNGTCWMLLFISVHAAIAVLAFSIFEKLFLSEEIYLASQIAFIGCLLFVISPYFTEPLVWYACIHYLFCMLLLLVAFRTMLFYLCAQQKKFILLYYGCFSISVFTLEISFVLPVILLLFFLFWSSKIFEVTKRLSLIKIFVAPSFLIVLLYFLLSKIFRGSIVGHYGAATHLNFDIELLMGNLAKYIAKLFFFSQFIDFKYRSKLYLLFERRDFSILFFLFLATGATLFFFFHKKLNSKNRIAILLFAFFVVALAPVINIFFSYIVNVEGDRFTYFASLFAYPLLAFVCIVYLRKAGWLLLACFFFFQVKFLLVNTESWRNAGYINQSLIEKFGKYSSEKIYLLNLPDNFHGAYMFRTFPPDDPYEIALDVKRHVSPTKNITTVMQYNMESIGDSVVVEKISDTAIKISFAQGGNWWWRLGVGAANYSTDDFWVNLHPSTNSYTIEFKNKLTHSVYLYQCAGEWREVQEF